MAGTISRVAALAGLRRLLDELDAHPSLPVPSTVTVELHADTDMDGFELVARAAHRMGVAATTSAQGTARATKRFGQVMYVVEYHPQHLAVIR